MPSRSYAQLCALARALELVGDRWTMLVVRHLTHGPRRFGELRDGLPGVSTALLADRLHRMVADGLVAESDEGYALTTFGRGVEPAMWELMRWGAGLLADPGRADEVAHADWVVFPLRWLLAQHPVDRELALLVDAPPRDPVLVRLTPRDAQLVDVLARDDDGRPVTGDASVDASLTAAGVWPLAAVLSGRRSYADAVEGGELTIVGDDGWFGAALAIAHATSSAAVLAGRAMPPAPARGTDG